MAAIPLSTRRERLRLIRVDLQRRHDAGEFGPDRLYTCAVGHEWLLRGYLTVLLHMASYMETWETERKAQPRYLETANYVAGELERVWELVKR